MSSPTTILVPTDFSERSEHALLYAASLGERFGASITLLHVVTFVGYEDEPIAADFPDMAPLIEKADRAARAHLDVGAEHGGAAEPSVKKAVVHGLSAHEAIKAYAEREGVDLIVIARRGRGELADVMLGSVTSRVVRFAPCPVLVVVRGEREFVNLETGAVNIGKVVFADNLSEGPERALRYAVEHVEPYKPEVHLVHAVSNHVPKVYEELGVKRSFRLDDDLRARLHERLLDRARGIVPDDWKVVTEVREGRPRRVVTRYAKEVAADLLVVGSERSFDLEERVLGGTSGRIVRGSPCPSLVA